MENNINLNQIIKNIDNENEATEGEALENYFYNSCIVEY